MILSIILLAVLLADSSIAQDKEKRAQTGMKFLSVATNARAIGMGEAVTALEGKSESMFFNPAGMARQKNFMSFTAGTTEWIADIDYSYASISIAPNNGEFGVFGITVKAVDYGEFIHTIPDGESSAIDIDTFSPTALAVGLGYAKALSDRFSVGGNIKYVYQDLSAGIKGGFVTSYTDGSTYESEKFDKGVMAFDLGILYKTGYKSLTFGMNVRNFSSEIEYIKESFQLPLMFEMGLSMDLVDLFEIDKTQHSFLFSIDATHPRDFNEQLNIGVEYTFLNTFSLRCGLITPTDEQGINAGVGIKRNVGGVDMAFDYAYTDFGLFDNLNRFTVSFGL
ncbi:MAG: PorV/PorQ family protein [Melioribacteraceae bacterium]|nr:PorV/PorQ family protein [Melioribacteraceae bacterium]